MRVLALFLLAVLVVPVNAQQPAIGWEPTGGPPVPARREVIAIVMTVATAPWGDVFVADGYGLFTAKDGTAWQKVLFSSEPGSVHSAYAVAVTSRATFSPRRRGRA